MTTPSPEALLRRIQLLEESHRNFKRSSTLAMTLLVAGAIAPLLSYIWTLTRLDSTHGPTGSGGFYGHELVLKDDRGRRRLALHTSDDEPKLSLYGADGAPLVTIGSKSWEVRDATGATRLQLRLDADATELRLTPREADQAVSLSASRIGPALQLLGADNQPLAYLGATTGIVNFSLLDEAGAERAGIGVTPNGSHLRLRDREARIRALLHTGNAGGCAVDFFDQNEVPKLSVGVGVDGMTTFDYQGPPPAGLASMSR